MSDALIHHGPAAAAALARLFEAVQSVLAILEEESLAIAAGHPEPLLRVVGEKSARLRALEIVSRDPAVIEALRHGDGSAELQALMARLEDCRQRNLATGSAITTARRDNELLLRALGQQPQPGAYTARGHTPVGTQARSLGRA